MNIAKDTCASRASKNACRLFLRLRQSLAIDSIHTESALSHYLTLLVQLSSAIRACPRAIAATDTFIVIHQHNPILFALIARTSRANRNTWRLFAMQTRFWKMNCLGIWECSRLKSLYSIEKSAAWASTIGVQISKRAC